MSVAMVLMIYLLCSDNTSHVLISQRVI